MNRYMYVWVAAPLLTVSAPSLAADVHPAQEQMKQNIDAVLSVARDKSLSEAQKVKRVEAYADRYLDYERIAALAVGAPWREFSAVQKKAFIAAFKEMVVSMYSHSALIGAADAQVRLLPKMTGSGNKFDVFSEIRTGSGKKYEVAYQLYRLGGAYKIYNIRVDGTSLVTVYRNQFGELIRQKGIDGAIETVKAKGLRKQ